ncbi:MAG: phage tail tube assembly chaperone [Sporolactobacillus sp.]
MAQIKINGKSFTYKESIKKTRRAYVYQKAVGEIYKSVIGNGETDETNELTSAIADIDGSAKVLDLAINFLVDILGEDKIDADYFEENVSLKDLRESAEKVAKKLVGADAEGASEGKKLPTAKPSEGSTTSEKS